MHSKCVSSHNSTSFSGHFVPWNSKVLLMIWFLYYKEERKNLWYYSFIALQCSQDASACMLKYANLDIKLLHCCYCCCHFHLGDFSLGILFTFLYFLLGWSVWFKWTQIVEMISFFIFFLGHSNFIFSDFYATFYFRPVRTKKCLLHVRYFKGCGRWRQTHQSHNFFK